MGMALSAVNAGMLTFERILRFGVIESFVDSLQRNLPACGAVA